MVKKVCRTSHFTQYKNFLQKKIFFFRMSKFNFLINIKRNKYMLEKNVILMFFRLNNQMKRNHMLIILTKVGLVNTTKFSEIIFIYR